MLDKALSPNTNDTMQDTVKVSVRLCNSCDQSQFHITSDNRILCSTCCKYVQGWHALGSVMQS